LGVSGDLGGASTGAGVQAENVIIMERIRIDVRALVMLLPSFEVVARTRSKLKAQPLSVTCRRQRVELRCAHPTVK
jgi:hypothetical protein